MKALFKTMLDAAFSAKPEYRKKLTNYLMGEKLTVALRDLKSKGVPVHIVYDIGARHGDWSAAIQRVLPDSKFILFEANQSCDTALKKRGFQYFIGVLSSEEKVVDFYQTDSTGDSYYRENTRRYDSVAPTKKATRAIDSVVQDNSLPRADFIKLDTQGSELDILRGGLESLKTCSLAYLECPALSYNQGAPNFQDYLEFLNGHGFVPYEICEIHYAYGALVQLDVLFIRKEQLRKLHAPSVSLPHFLE